MNRILAILLSSTMIAGVAIAAPDYGPQAGPVMIGVYGDRDGSSSQLEVTAGEQFDIYVVLRAIGLDQGVRGWECAVKATPNVQFVEWSYEGRALNICQAPEFAVGLAEPLPRGGKTLLAHARCLLTDDQPARVWTTAVARSSVTPAVPAYVASDPEARGATRACDAAGESFALKINDATDPVRLGNAPNPFNPQTTIRFSLPSAQAVRLVVYGLDGHRVATLVDETLAAGQHAVPWQGRDDNGQVVASGTYVYRLETQMGEVQTARMVLVR